MYPGNSLGHTGCGDLSVFDLFAGKHTELMAHAPGENRTMTLKKQLSLFLVVKPLPNLGDCDYGNSLSQHTVEVRQSFCLCG